MAVPSHVALALHVPLHCTLSCPGSQATVTSGGVHVASPLQVAVQLACALTSTWHPPPVTASVQVACACACASTIALIFVWACVQGSVTLSSAVALALQVSVTPRSVSMPMQAFRTAVSIAPATATRSALACTNVFVLTSIDKPATPPLWNSSQPAAA